MTKGSIYLPSRAVGYTSRRFKQRAFTNVAYLTDAEKLEHQELLSKMKTMAATELETRGVLKSDLKAITDAMPDFRDFPLEALRAMTNDKTGVMVELAKQGLELQKLETRIARGEEHKDMSIRGQIKSWLEMQNDESDETKTGIKVIDAVRQIKAKKNVPLRDLEIQLNVRAATSPMVPSGFYGGSAYIPKPEIAPGLVDVIRPQPTFWDTIKKGATGSAVYVWINKKVPAGSGAAGFIAPGVYKPAVSFNIASQISNAKKIAANEKVAIELLDDVDGLASWVEDELMYQVMQKASLTLMNSAGDANTPTGIQNLSVPFPALSGIKTVNPNNWDAIRAVVGVLRASNFNFPVIAYINPIDYSNMVMTKAISQGQLFLPPNTGATIIEDTNVPVGYLQIGCIDLYKVLIYKGFTMTWGLENDDFTKNLRTVIGEMRIHQFFSDNHTGSLIYDTFANIIADIAIIAP